MKLRVNITIDEETHEKLKEMAKEYHTTVSQMITFLVWDKTKQNEKTNDFQIEE